MTRVAPFVGGDVAALAEGVAGGHISAVDLIGRSFARLSEVDDGSAGVHAFLSRDPAGAEAAARSVDEEAARGRAGPLAGVPVAVKDNLCTLDLPTTCASLILEDYRSPYEATAVRRLREAGAVVVGKTNLDEFAMGSSTENSAFGPTRNPHDADRVPGGSSGGSAAAVAAGIVPAALGSDTGGSVRQPAALCGVVGLKPTYGRVSRYGLVAFASSLDQVGTIGRTVLDAALLLQAIAGPDPFDATSSAREVPDLAAAAAAAGVDPAEGIRRLVIGVPEEYFPAELHPGVASRCRAALDVMERAGAEVRPVRLAHSARAIPAYYLIAPAEASSNLARYDGVRFGRRVGEAATTAELYESTRSRGFGAEVKRRIMLGTFALSAGYRDAYYGRAQVVRDRIAAELGEVFASGVHVLFTPTTPAPAFRLGEKTADPYQMYLADVFTVTANLAGVPAISLPVGLSDGLPVGAQFLAPWWQEGRMVAAAASLERLLAA